MMDGREREGEEVIRGDEMEGKGEARGDRMRRVMLMEVDGEEEQDLEEDGHEKAYLKINCKGERFKLRREELLVFFTMQAVLAGHDASRGVCAASAGRCGPQQHRPPPAAAGRSGRAR